MACWNAVGRKSRFVYVGSQGKLLRGRLHHTMNSLSRVIMWLYCTLKAQFLSHQKVKVMVSVESPDIYVATHVLQTLPPQAVGAQQPATIDPTLDQCIRYPLRLGGPRQCGIQSTNTNTKTLLHMASTANWTPGLLILSPMPYPLGHMLPNIKQVLCPILPCLIHWYNNKQDQTKKPMTWIGTGQIERIFMNPTCLLILHHRMSLVIYQH